MHCCRQDVKIIKLMREGWELMPSTCSEFTMKHQQLKQTCITFHQDLIAQQAKFEDTELLDTYYCCSCCFPQTCQLILESTTTTQCHYKKTVNITKLNVGHHLYNCNYTRNGFIQRRTQEPATQMSRNGRNMYQRTVSTQT